MEVMSHFCHISRSSRPAAGPQQRLGNGYCTKIVTVLKQAHLQYFKLQASSSAVTVDAPFSDSNKVVTLFIAVEEKRKDALKDALLDALQDDR